MNNKHLTPVWIVYVDGQRLDIAHEGALQRIVVDDKLNDVGLATLEFDTSYLQVRDAGTFWLESEVSVHLGYKDDCQQVFVGEVTEFIQEYREYGHQRLKVVCKNCLHRLQNAHQTLSFEFKTLSEALVSRLESYGIKAQVDSFGTKKYFVESQITDYEFLMESANKYGKTVYAHGNKVYVQDEVTISNEDVVLEWGKSLVYFRGRESLKGQLSGCSFVGWDSRRGQGITGRVSLSEVPVRVGGGRSWEDNSKAAGGRWHSTIMEESLRDREEAVVLAKAYLQNLSMQYQTAECKCEGDQRILPGMRVTVKYVGESYSGEYIASHVIHEFSVYGGYTTTLYLRRNMAGGEKKRVSPIDSEMMRERLRRMEERMHGPVDREGVAVDEAEVEPALAAETVPPAESQETGEEKVSEESIEKSRVEYQWPTTEGRITSAFGSREDAVPNPHPGIDIAPMIPGQKGQDILSAENGTVIIVGMSAGGSSEIHIEHTNGEVSIYKHHNMQSVQVKVGDGVYKGEKIAEMSDVGSPGAVHLHFEIRPSAGLRQKDAIDPVPKLPDIPATMHLTEAVERSGNTLKNK